MTEKTMNLTATEEKMAQALYHAYTTMEPLDMGDWQKTLTNDDMAYRVQARLMELKQAPVAGYKVSLTSKQTQDMFNSTEPLYGAQVASHFVKSPVSLSLTTDLMSPLAEVELVFKAKEDLLPTDSLETLLQKTTVVSGVEVPDSRFKDWFPDLPKELVVADAAVGGYVVYGNELDTSSFTVDDLATVKADLFHDNKLVNSGDSSEVLGNPLKSLQWLVQKLAKQGQTLTKGQMVSSGTFLLPPHLTAGDWRASFNHGFSDVELKVN